MYNNKQNNLESIKDKLQRGVITVDEANVEKVLCQRVLLVNGKIPASVRKALNDAVKKEILAHWKKMGLAPEVYFHPNFRYLAKEAISKHLSNIKKVVASICA